MLPIRSDSNQEGCSPISSNCIIWQGNDIPCINLCKGDSISDVTAKLATELCDILAQLQLTGGEYGGFDLSCFNPICPTLDNFHDLVQFIITKLCELQNIPAANADTAECPDCYATLPVCLQTTDPLGNPINQLTLKEYAEYLATTICNLISQISVINATLTSQQTQITALINSTSDLAGRPSNDLPTFYSTCLSDKLPGVPPGSADLTQMINAIQEAFCELRTATGMPNSLLLSILRQCAGLDTAPSLNLPGVNMGSLAGWVLQGTYSTVADSINNMWITICDMRAAIQTILDTCCDNGCAGLTLSLLNTFSTPNLSLFFVGDATAFADCNPAGSKITITDAYGNKYITFALIVPNMNLPYVINLGPTALNLNTNLIVTVEACLERLSDKTTCERTISTIVEISTPCPVLTLDSDPNNVTFSFTNTIVGAATYEVSLYDGVTLISSQSIVVAAPGAVSGTFGGLTPSTTYGVTVAIYIGAVLTNTCPSALIATKAQECPQPTSVTVETNPVT
jgi:hypothetical protein